MVVFRRLCWCTLILLVIIFDVEGQLDCDSVCVSGCFCDSLCLRLQDCCVGFQDACTQRCDDFIFDLIFVPDSSFAVGQNNFEHIKQHMKDILFGVDIDGGNVRVGLMPLNSGDQSYFNLNDYQTKADVFQAIDNLEYQPGTFDIPRVLEYISTQMFNVTSLDRPEAGNYLIPILGPSLNTSEIYEAYGMALEIADIVKVLGFSGPNSSGFLSQNILMGFSNINSIAIVTGNATELANLRLHEWYFLCMQTNMTAEVNSHDNNYYVDGFEQTFYCSSTIHENDITGFRWVLNDTPLQETPSDSLQRAMHVGFSELKCYPTFFYNNSYIWQIDQTPVTFDVVPMQQPSIDIVPQHPVLFYGNSYTFYCTNPSVPASAFISHLWRFNDVEEQLDTNDYALQITMQPEQEITITCANQLPNENITISEVLAMYVIGCRLAINIEPTDGFYEVGFTYILRCFCGDLIMEPQFVTSYVWKRDGQTFADSDVPYRYIQAWSTTHNYTCAVSVNSVESPMTSAIQVQAKSIVDVHVENNGERRSIWRPVFDSNMPLTCESSLKAMITDEPTYQWFENDIPFGTGKEIIINIYPGYIRDVRCTVTVGTDSQMSETVSVIGQELPSIPSLLAFNDIGHPSRTYQYGQSYNLQCYSDSKADGTLVQWVKDGETIKCVHEFNLKITRFNPPTHAGEYQCRTVHLGRESLSNILQLKEDQS